jgi:hypothetical protein
MKEMSEPRKIKAERGVVVPLPVRSEGKKKDPSSAAVRGG